MSEPRAIVIGSGLGGSAATLLLAEAGLRTTLIEKNRRLGGSCAGYEKQGFRVDIGTHMFCRGDAGPLGEVLRRVGEGGAITFRRTRDIAELRIAWGPDHAPTLVRIPVPAELHRMPAFLWRLYRTAGMTPREAARAARLFAHALTADDGEIARWDHRTVEDYVQRFTDHGPTVGLFGFLLGLYFILPYWEVSAGEALWSFGRMIRDNRLSYPLGGAAAIPGTYCRLAAARGAEIRTGTGVRRVLVERGAVRGVELSDGTRLPADVVVSTSSLRTTVEHLVGPDRFPAEYVDRVRRLRGSFIAVQAKVGLRRRRVDAGAIVGGFGHDRSLLDLTPGDFKAIFSAVERGEVPEVVPFYCPVPTNFDPDLAPPGHQLLTICAVAPTTDVALRDPGPAWEEAMLRALRRVVPGIDDDVVFIDRFSVEFIERWIGKRFGPAVSTGQTPDQVGPRRPPVFTPIRGLYVAGCGAGARGVGTELAAASGMDCADRVLRDLGRAAPWRDHREPDRDAVRRWGAPLCRVARPRP